MASNIPPLPPGFTLDEAKQQDQQEIPPLPPGFTLDTSASAPATSPMQDMGKTMMQAGKVTPLFETAANLISSTYGVPLSGIAGIMGAVYGALETGETSEGMAETFMKKVQDLTIYQPQTEGGQELTDTAMYPMKKLSEGAAAVADPIAEKYGPTAGATVKTGIEALPLAFTPGVRGVKAGVGKVRGMVGQAEKAAQLGRAKPFQEEGVQITKGELTNKLPAMRAEKHLMEASTSGGEKFRRAQAERVGQLKSGLEEASGRPGTTLAELRQEVGELTTEALKSRKKQLQERKDSAYAEALDDATELGNVQIVPDLLVANAPKMKEMVEIYDAAPSARQGRALQTHFYKYGLRELVPERFANTLDASGKVDVTPLSVANFERFRQGLNRINRQDKGGPLYEIINPIKEALDLELSEMVKVKGTENLPKEIYDNLLKARDTVVEMKTEFSPKQLTGKLVDKNNDGFTPVIEASQVFDKMMVKSMPPEQLQNTLLNLSKSGEKGKQAIAAIQSAAVMDLVESGFTPEGVFNAKTFKNRLKNNQEKLDVLFRNSPEIRRKLANYDKIAEYIQNTAKDKPTLIRNLITSFGMINLMSKFPGMSAVLGILRIGGEAATTAKTAKAALNPKIPGQPGNLGKLANEWPNIAAFIKGSTKYGVRSSLTATVADKNKEDED